MIDEEYEPEDICTENRPKEREKDITDICSHCGGEGAVEDVTCAYCKGSGKDTKWAKRVQRSKRNY